MIKPTPDQIARVVEELRTRMGGQTFDGPQHRALCAHVEAGRVLDQLTEDFMRELRFEAAVAYGEEDPK